MSIQRMIDGKKLLFFLNLFLVDILIHTYHLECKCEQSIKLTISIYIKNYRKESNIPCNGKFVLPILLSTFLVVYVIFSPIILYVKNKEKFFKYWHIDN